MSFAKYLSTKHEFDNISKSKEILFEDTISPEELAKLYLSKQSIPASTENIAALVDQIKAQLMQQNTANAAAGQKTIGKFGDAELIQDPANPDTILVKAPDKKLIVRVEKKLSPQEINVKASELANSGMAKTTQQASANSIAPIAPVSTTMGPQREAYNLFSAVSDLSFLTVYNEKLDTDDTDTAYYNELKDTTKKLNSPDEIEEVEVNQTHDELTTEDPKTTESTESSVTTEDPNGATITIKGYDITMSLPNTISAEDMMDIVRSNGALGSNVKMDRQSAHNPRALPKPSTEQVMLTNEEQQLFGDDLDLSCIMDMSSNKIAKGLVK